MWSTRARFSISGAPILPLSLLNDHLIRVKVIWRLIEVSRCIAFARQVAQPYQLFQVTSDHGCDRRKCRRHPSRALLRRLILFHFILSLC